MAKPYSIPLGTVFSHLTYLGQPEKATSGGGATFLFQCSCGNLKRSKKSAVVHGKTVSCGCHKARLVSERMRSHGRSQDGAGSAYLTWQNMTRRCNSPYATGYKEYGGRGIRVCERWQTFENFLADMGERPDGTTLDRYPDKNGNYEPGNVRWATQTEQMFNTRRTYEIPFHGEIITTGDLSDLSGVSIVRVRYRIARGASAEEAMDPNNLNETVVSHQGLSMNISSWERHLGLNRNTVATRLRRGDSIERALRPVKPTQRKK